MNPDQGLQQSSQNNTMPIQPIPSCTIGFVGGGGGGAVTADIAVILNAVATLDTLTDYGEAML